MKILAPILFLIILNLPIVVKVGVLVDFKINQNFIIKTLCINKDKPATKCNGKCQLSKQLKKAEENEQKQIPKSTRLKAEILLYFQTQSIFDGMFPSQENQKYAFSRKNFIYNSAFLNSIFRPPRIHFI